MFLRRAYRFVRDYYKQRVKPESLQNLVRRGLTIGRDCQIMDSVSIDPCLCWLVHIGNQVVIAPGVRILAHDGSSNLHTGYTRLGEVRIGDRVFIGAGSIILPGVTVGDDVIIGAGSLVTRDLPSSVVAAGNPARIVCSLDQYLERRRRELQQVPVFQERHTMDWDPGEHYKRRMRESMAGGVGYAR